MSAKKYIDAAVGLLIIAIFVTGILPALSTATNQSTTIFYIAFIFLGIAIILSILK